MREGLVPRAISGYSGHTAQKCLNLYLSPIETSGAREDGDGFDVLGVGEQVHGRQALKAVAGASEMLEIAHLRVGLQLM